MRKFLTVSCVLALAAFCSPARAALITFDATLNGAQEPRLRAPTAFITRLSAASPDLPDLRY